MNKIKKKLERIWDAGNVVGAGTRGIIDRVVLGIGAVLILVFLGTGVLIWSTLHSFIAPNKGR